VAEEAVALLRPLAKEQNITIAAEVEPVTVAGDRTALAQILGNLLENAIRYNKPQGEVRVGVKEKDGAAEVRVTDTGIGIPAADLPHVFDRFYRVDKARTRVSGGTGLGLAIVQTLVEAHGGTVAVESTPDVGTTVRVRLPLSPAEPEATPAGGQDSTPSPQEAASGSPAGR
jgi:signal transduction histidine kinase